MKKIRELVVKVFLLVTSSFRRNRLWLTLATTKFLRRQRITNPRFGDGSVSWFVPTTHSLSRVILAHEKEPMTQNWIRNFKPGSVLWDIGANVGIFTFLAASMGHKVVAIEPLPSSVANLVKTAELNRGHEVIIFPIGISAHDGSMSVKEASLEAGQTGFEFQADNPSILYPLMPTLNAASLQKLLPEAFRLPNHVKIDTDGNEEDILRGFGDLNLWTGLQSILVESETGPSESKIFTILNDQGFERTQTESTVPSNRKSQFFNHIFERV